MSNSLDFYLSTTLQVMAIIALGFVILAIVTMTVQEWRNPGVRKLVVDQIRAIVGLPTAAIIAFLIITMVTTYTGEISFKAPGGFEIKGAAGPIIFWVIIFLAFSAGIKMLWNDTKGDA